VNEMEWPLILALALLVPCVLMPAFLIWYLHRDGVVFSVKVTREKRRPAKADPLMAVTETGDPAQYEEVLLNDLKRYLEKNPPVPE
jgi:hypothetical protein